MKAMLAVVVITLSAVPAMAKYDSIIKQLCIDDPKHSGCVWDTVEKTDSFDGTSAITASSPVVVGEPYGYSGLLVRCSSGNDLDVFIAYGYLNRPGADDAPIMVKFDNEAPRQQSVSESTNGKGLFLKGGRFAHKLARATSFVTRFDYYREGAVTIAYDLKGAKEPIEKVLAACNALDPGKHPDATTAADPLEELTP